ncbi:MAG: hypothetical protein P4L65_09690 [Legionella sp.]|nr:hypothetical protein [Legionella sp.]
MTIGIKDLRALKIDFDNAVKSVLANESSLASGAKNIGKIEDTGETRKPILVLLNVVLNHLIAQAEKNDKSIGLPIAFYPHAFYGLVGIARAHIHKTRWTALFDSTLDHILSTIGQDKKSPNKPDVEQAAEFTIAINEYLKTLFKDSDSRQGINAQHPLHEIPTEYLRKFLTLGYELENVAQIERINAASIKTIDESADTNHYKAKKEPPKSAIDSINKEGDWGTLHTVINDLYYHELGLQGGTIEKFALNSPKRATEMQFLFDLKTILIKDAKLLSDKERTAILAGAMYLIRAEIKAEYKYTDPNKSHVYKTLSELLNTGTTSYQDKEALLSAANHFCRFVTLKAADEQKIFRTNLSEFSKAPAFDFQKALISFQTMTLDCRKEALAEAINAFSVGNKPAEKASSSSSWGWGMFSDRKQAAATDESKPPVKSVTTEEKAPSHGM